MSLLNATTSPRQLAIGLTILRVILGITFIMHGGQKLFVFGIEGVSGGFVQMGLPPALGPFVGAVEFLGGIALVLGLLTRLAAFGVGAMMIGAILTVHLKAGFFAPNGYEFNLALLAAATTLVFTGAGQVSLDALLSRRFTSATTARTATTVPVAVPRAA